MTAADAKEFLKSLEGQWKSVADGPAQVTGASKNVAVGEYWLALDSVADLPTGTLHGHLLLGFDPAGSEFNAAGVNSLTNSMTRMTGKLESPTRLVLQYEGAAPGDPSSKKVAYRDVTTVESEDRYTVTSHLKNEDGAWVRIMSITNERVSAD